MQKDPVRKKAMDAHRAKKYRERLKLDSAKQEENRRKSNERKRRNRQVKIQAVIPEKSAFSTVQQKGKYMRKTINALPNDPKMRAELLLTALNETLILDKTLRLPEKSRNIASLSSEKISKINDFYCDDDFSRMSPNVKDFISINQNGKKSKHQIRHLQFSVKEVFEEFKKQNPDVKISLSKFAELKPPFVRSVTKVPHNVCCCLIHENMRYALESLMKVDATLQNLYVGNGMDKNFICESSSTLCYVNQCANCEGLKLFESCLENVESLELTISWKLWQKPEKKSYISIEKVTKEGTVDDLIKHIGSMRQKFVSHAEVKRIQSNVFKSNIENSRTDTSVAVLQIDWAENYKCFAQHETQAAHFGQNQTSIFTAALWTQQVSTFAIVSDSLDHTKNSVIANIDKLCEQLPDSVKILHIHSDNATSQFKNKDTLASMIQLEKQHSIKICWHFFAAMHGKGVVDGVGAAVKRVASNKTKAETAVIVDAESFANALESSVVKVMYLSDEEKSRRNIRIGLKSIIAQSKKLKDISKSHFFNVVNGTVKIQRVSPSQN